MANCVMCAVQISGPGSYCKFCLTHVRRPTEQEIVQSGRAFKFEPTTRIRLKARPRPVQKTCWQRLVDDE